MAFLNSLCEIRNCEDGQVVSDCFVYSEMDRDASVKIRELIDYNSQP